MKPLHWLGDEISAPPLSGKALTKAGYLLKLAQNGELPPTGKMLKGIGDHVYQIRVNDQSQSWRIVYHTTPDAVVILHVFSKKTQKTPKQVIDLCKRRLQDYNNST